MKHFYFGKQPDMDQLILQYEAMAEKGKNTSFEITTFLQLIEFYEEESSLSKAIEVSEKALLQHKFSSELHLKKAKLLMLDGKNELALESLDRAEVFGHPFVEIDILRSKVNFCLLDYDKALDTLINLRMNSYITLEELVIIYIQEAIIYDEKGWYDRMYYTLKSALEIIPDCEEALRLFGRATRLTKNFKQSIEIYHTLLEKQAYSHLGWYYLGEAYYKTLEYEYALQCFEFSFLVDESFHPAYTDFIEVCMQLQKYHKALQCLEEAKPFFNHDDEFLLKVGQCYEYMGDLSKAKIFYFKALAINKSNDEIYFHIGECYAREQKWNNATYFYNKAIQLNEEREDYVFSLANTYCQLEFYNKALPLYNKATTLAPEISKYWAHYAAFLFKQNQISSALEILNTAEESTYGPDLNYCKSACLFATGQPKAGLYYLGEGLIEDFTMHPLLFGLLPELQLDSDVQAIIHYYQGEQ